MNLKATPPADAKTRFLNKKRSHVTDKTIHNYDATLRQFLDFLDSEGTADMRDVTSDTIARFEEHHLRFVKPITCRNDMRIVKNFIQFASRFRPSPPDHTS
jgi:site-specific recombinase XerD